MVAGGAVNGRRLPVLWLCGPAGVGKSTVAWQLFTELALAGAHLAFVDTDQLGMCCPALPGDREGVRVKARNLGVMIPNYQAAGARCVIVNGVVDPVTGPRPDLLPVASVISCRLRASADEVVCRFTARDGQPDADLVREVRIEAAQMDRSTFADACVDTTGVPAGEVARLVRTACASWPGFARTMAEPASRVRPTGRRDGGAADADGQVMVICGPAGVGKSTIGFQFYLECLNAGLAAGYVDLDQIGFIRPAPGSRAGRHVLKARNLAAIWQNCRAAGATHLIATGPIEDNEAARIYARELPAATITLCRLRAGPGELEQRIMSRGSGGSWPQPGDPLRGQPAEVLRQAAARAVGEAAALDRASLDTVTIDTDGRAPDHAARLIGQAASWPGPDHGQR